MSRKRRVAVAEKTFKMLGTQARTVGRQAFLAPARSACARFRARLRMLADQVGALPVDWLRAETDDQNRHVARRWQTFGSQRRQRCDGGRLVVDVSS